MSEFSVPKLRYPALDGLRGVAVTAVFFSHYSFPHSGLVRLGWIGVDIFFVLSGFLITGILFDSRHRANHIRNFYMRRVLRILPLYYAFWIVAAISGVYFAWQWKPAHLLYLVHLGNYIPFLSPNPEFQTTAAAVRSGLGRHMGTFPYLALGTFWSLCVEEQFYLLWPSVMFSRLSRQALLRICLAAVPATMMLRLLLFLFAPHVFITRNLLYSFTCTRVDSFLIGGALALALRGSEAVWLERKRHLLLPVAHAVFASSILYCWLQRGTPVQRLLASPLVSIAGFTVVDVCAAAVILHAIQQGSWMWRALQWKPLQSLGVISYGFYLLHEPIYVAYYSLAIRIVGSGASDYLAPILGFAGTVLIATLSYRYLETPFLRMKDRFKDHQQPRPAPQLQSHAQQPVSLDVAA